MYLGQPNLHLQTGPERKVLSSEGSRLHVLSVTIKLCKVLLGHRSVCIKIAPVIQCGTSYRQ